MPWKEQTCLLSAIRLVARALSELNYAIYTRVDKCVSSRAVNFPTGCWCRWCGKETTYHSHPAPDLRKLLCFNFIKALTFSEGLSLIRKKNSLETDAREHSPESMPILPPLRKEWEKVVSEEGKDRP